MNVEIEHHAPPVVHAVATTARRALRTRSIARRAARLNGSVALVSSTDPQRVTMTFTSGTLRFSAGCDRPDVRIVADLADPDAKPQVSGALRHPLLALAAAKLLEPSKRPWTEEADEFCTRALESSDCPRPIRAVCTDDGTERQWGGDGEAAVEIHASASELEAGFSGETVLSERLLEGHIFSVGTLADLSALTKFSIDRTLGAL